MKLLKTQIGGTPVEARSEMVNGVLWVHFNGRTWAVDSATKNQRKKRSSRGESVGGDLEAPMPGKVTKVMKAAGDRVERGEAVLVMEAMKMEYTLKAEVDGKVVAVNCQAGEQVALGQILVTIEPVKAEA